jgi:4-aminobutyrate aminotransferase-like enzyme/Ser/Thr protein kinase RdoA (MazF antagonist)
MITSISTQQVATWLSKHYGLEVELKRLAGDVDLNFLGLNSNQHLTVKVSCVQSINQFEFEAALLSHAAIHNKETLQLPSPVNNQNNQWLTICQQTDAMIVVMRVLNWIDGILWSDYLPHTDILLTQLGQQAACLDQILSAFSHPAASYEFEWDLAQSLWVTKHTDQFSAEQQVIIKHFIGLFETNQIDYQQLRKQIIHNDLNDNNIVINHQQPVGFIDFGDAIHSQLINEVAILCAYALMNKPDPLTAAVAVLQGFHKTLPLTNEELKHLYHLIGMRLVVSVTQSAIARIENPDNKYKSVSEQAAWELLNLWQQIPSQLAYYTFRHACGMPAHPNEVKLSQYLKSQTISLNELFPEHHNKHSVREIDLSVGSILLGGAADYENHAEQLFKMQQLQSQHPNQFLAGGYLEARSFYAADAFSFEGNSGKEYRTMHLGLDIWLPAQTAIHAPLAGRIVGFKDNDFKRDYGPTIILEHSYPNGVFYSLYGHLSRQTLSAHQLGDQVEQGQFLAWVGEPKENGGWSPHLHLQFTLDLLNNQHDFPGACRPKQLAVMQSLCPDPLLLFDTSVSSLNQTPDNQTLIEFRHQHLGKSLSLAYSEPIQMLRGDDVYLIDQYGQKYLDTCNNVAHVGHENPKVVKAGQQQMAVLNTNSRYLHPAINQFTTQLLATLPKQLSVVHLVNSGSEANELALRMAKAYTGGEQVIALESGYHGNSNACIDISSYKFDGKGGHGAPKNTHIVPLPDSFRGRHRGVDAGQKYAAYVDQVIDKLTQNKQQLSAFIAESIVSCGGQIELPATYLQTVYQAVRAAGGVCIADEVQVGCGRIGTHFWAFEPHGVVPDILTIGKPIGNGHPLAVVVCSRQVADRFANGMEYFNTFGGNPVSATIGTAVLDEIENQNLQLNARQTGDYLKLNLSNMMKEFPIIKDVRGQGLFLGFELCNKQLQPLPKQAQYLADRMCDLGILISTDGPDHNVIKIKPPITFNQQHADELLLRLTTVLRENPMRAASQDQ